MYKGGCLCGKVRFEILAGIDDIIYCHCSLCRKAQGSAFATNGNVDADAFRFVTGEDQLNGYEATPGQTKFFCRHCGSPIISKKESVPEKVRVRLGTIESEISERPQAHIYVGSKASWETICGDLPQLDTCKED